MAHDWDQLQRQLDDLRAEVERQLGQSKAALLNAKQSQDGWSEALKLRDAAAARAEAAERECDEAQAQTRHWREAAVKENERAMEYLNAAAEAQVADLRGAMEAWAWVERTGVSPEGCGKEWQVYAGNGYGEGPTPLAAVLDAMEKEKA